MSVRSRPKEEITMIGVPAVIAAAQVGMIVTQVNQKTKTISLANILDEHDRYWHRRDQIERAQQTSLGRALYGEPAFYTIPDVWKGA